MLESKLKLKRPIIFFDLETTGVDTSKDRIVEIGLIKIFPSGEREAKTRLVNPTIPIPKEASDIHGITDENVKDQPTFSKLAVSLAEYFKGCDIGGYNSNRFDVPLLVEEFMRCGVNFPEEGTRLIDAYKIFTINEQRTLAAAYKFYCGKEIENAHSAQADIEATVEVFFSQLERYNEVPLDITGIDEYCREGKEVVDYAGCITKDESDDFIFAFGKNKGLKVKDCLDYVSWMLKSDFTLDTKKKLREIVK